jgi:TonB-dependent starch-binding outer membrane protein SusC
LLNHSLNRWQAPGDRTDIQKFTQTFGPEFNGYSFAALSNLAYTDASFIRFKNISLAYNFPVKWLTGMHMNTGQIYITGQNIFTITKYEGLDPENNNGFVVPPLRIVTLGIKLSF